MVATDVGRFTAAVFQDADSASRLLTTLIDTHGFPREAISIVARRSPDVDRLMEATFGVAGETVDVQGLGACAVHGPLRAALDGAAKDSARLGIAATMRRVGFQAHDGFIYETLAARGGVLVAIHSEPRAADALAVMFAYGGGSAAIGAWTGRV